MEVDGWWGTSSGETCSGNDNGPATSEATRLIEDGGEKVLSISVPWGSCPHCNGKAYACTEILQNKLYIIRFEAKHESPSNNSYAMMSVYFGFQSDYYTLSNYITDDVGFNIWSNTGWHTIEKVFSLSEDRDLLRIMGLCYIGSNNVCVPNDSRVFVKNMEIIPLEYPNQVICQGNLVQLVPTCESEINSLSTPIVYEWTPTTGLNNSTIYNPIATPTVTTNYVVNVTQESDEHTTEVNVEVLTNGEIIPHNVSICNTPIEICATGNTNYNWNTGETTECLNVSSAGTYTCTSQLSTCNLTDEYIVTDSPEMSITNIEPANCNDGSISIVGGMVTYEFSIENYDGSYTNTQSGLHGTTFNNLTNGTYSITTTDINTGCISTLTGIVVPGGSNPITQSGISELTLINNNFTWDQQFYEFNTDVIIENGVTLTITNLSRINFSEGHGFIIDGTGKLIVNGNSIISNICTGAWRGITFTNNNSWSTAPSVTFENSTLQNAVIGIDIANGYSNINITNNTQFKNNYIDLRFNYNSVNNIDYSGKVYITGSEFITDQTLSGITNMYSYPGIDELSIQFNLTYHPNSHIIINNSKGIKISDNNFRNYLSLWITPPNPMMGTQGTIRTISTRGNGIVAENSTFTSISNTFDQLWYAIKAIDLPQLTGNTLIKSCDFNNNYKGVFSELQDGISITNNTFNVWSEPYSGLIPGVQNPQINPAYPYGLYLNESEGYDFRVNHFEGHDSYSSGGAIIGAYINNCGTSANKVYKNTFSKFKSYNPAANYKATGLIISGVNGVSNTGLEVKCNDFSYDASGYPQQTNLANWYDVALVNGAVIKQEQGSFSQIDSKKPANNRFAKYYDPNQSSGNRAIYAYSYSGSNIDYWRHTNNTELDPENNATSTKVNVQNISSLPAFNKVQDCPDDPNQIIIIKGGLKSTNTESGIDEFANLLNSVENDITNLNDELNSIIDNGNTATLQTEVETATPSTYTTVANKVSNANGYISDNVLLSFMDINTDKPISKTITLLNNSPLPYKAKQEIDNTQLPENLKNYLRNFQNGQSVREIKESIIGDLKNKKQEYIHSAVNDVLNNDSTGEYIMPLINVLNNYNDVFTQTKVYKLLLQTANKPEAENKLSQMRSLTNSMNQEQALEFNNWLDLQEIVLSLTETNKVIDSTIIAQNFDFISSLAQTNNAKGQIQAQNLLNKSKLALYYEHTILPEYIEDLEDKNSKINKSNTSLSNTEDMDLIYIYPNPVKDILTIEYALLSNASINSLSIYSINGSLVKTININQPLGVKQIDVTSLSEGTYIISFGNNGIGSYSKKFTVKK